MSDPKKVFICKKCGTKINDLHREWGSQTPCQYCLREEYIKSKNKRKLEAHNG